MFGKIKQFFSGQSKSQTSYQKEVLPTQQYLQKVFLKLKKEKSQDSLKDVQFETVYKGFRSISIQKLEPKKLPKMTQMDGKSLWSESALEVYCYEQSCPLTKQHYNGFFSAFFEAYINHGEVKITPDDVWMAIMLFFSKYIDTNAEKLRQAFVNHEGKKELVIQTEEASEYDWNEFFDKIIIAIKENTVKGVTEKFQCAFSTTDKFFRLFSTAVIMNSYKKYFDYTRMIIGCGIQKIHMGGSLEDWEQVGKRLSSLKEFDVDGKLKFYVRRLEPVLEQFIETYKGHAHIQFWNNIYHERVDPEAHAYMPTMHANGWILRFFTTNDVVNEIPGIQTIDVPIKLVNLRTRQTKFLNLLGGCKGVSIEKNVYRPHYSFSIVEKFEEAVKRKKF